MDARLNFVKIQILFFSNIALIVPTVLSLTSFIFLSAPEHSGFGGVF
jgi:hypothetical protein